MWALIETYVTLLRGEIERNGVSTWPPERPVRDALISGALTVPLLAATALWDGASIAEALLTGLACGVFVIAPPASSTGEGYGDRSHL